LTFNEQSYQLVKVCGSLSSEDVDIHWSHAIFPLVSLLLPLTMLQSLL